MISPGHTSLIDMFHWFTSPSPHNHHRKLNNNCSLQQGFSSSNSLFILCDIFSWSTSERIVLQLTIEYMHNKLFFPFLYIVAQTHSFSKLFQNHFQNYFKIIFIQNHFQKYFKIIFKNISQRKLHVLSTVSGRLTGGQYCGRLLSSKMWGNCKFSCLQASDTDDQHSTSWPTHDNLT